MPVYIEQCLIFKSNFPLKLSGRIESMLIDRAIAEKCLTLLRASGTTSPRRNVKFKLYVISDVTTCRTWESDTALTSESRWISLFPAGFPHSLICGQAFFWRSMGLIAFASQREFLPQYSLLQWYTSISGHLDGIWYLFSTPFIH